MITAYFTMWLLLGGEGKLRDQYRHQATLGESKKQENFRAYGLMQWRQVHLSEPLIDVLSKRAAYFAIFSWGWRDEGEGRREQDYKLRLTNTRQLS